METYVIRAHGGPEVLARETRPLPEPGPGEARVRVRAVALNHLDLWVRRGVPGHRFPLPLIPGSDGAGILTALGPRTEVDGLGPGSQVLLAPGFGCGQCSACLGGHESLCRHYRILGESRDGTCAHSILVPAGALLPLPADLELEEAAALPLALMTTWQMLMRRGRLQPGETVLVHAGGSGIGSAAIQIAAAIGCRVLTTVGSTVKVRRAAELGADEVILYQTTDLVAAVRSLTGKRGVDLVVEHTGAATWEASLRCLRRGGRLVTCGATTGADVQLNLRLLFYKQLELIGSTMGSRADLAAALELVARGRLRPVVDRVFPIEALADAHRYLEERRAFGKIVLRGFAGD